MPGVCGRRFQDDGRAGLMGGADRDPAHPAVFDVLPNYFRFATLNATAARINSLNAASSIASSL
jgi:hypothetical protein